MKNCAAKLKLIMYVIMFLLFRFWFFLYNNSSISFWVHTNLQKTLGTTGHRTSYFFIICCLGEIPKLQYPNDDAAKMHKSSHIYIPTKHNNANYKENRHLFSQWKRNSQHFYFGVSLHLKKLDRYTQCSYC